MNKKINILVVTGHSGIESGGVGTHLKILLDELKNDQDIHLDVIFGKGKIGKGHVFLSRIVGKHISSGLVEVLEFFLNIYYMKKRIEDVIRNNPAGQYIIHAHDRNATIAAGLLKSQYKIKIVQTIHAPYYQQYLINANLPQDSLLKEFIYAFDKNTIKFVDEFIAVDNLQRDLMLRDFSEKLDDKKITVISNAVEKSMLKEIEKKYTEKYIVVARHLYKKNGVEFAIKAFNILKNKKFLKMYIIGSGDEKENLRALVKKFRLENNIIFKGRLSRENTVEYINNALVSIVPSVPVGDYIEATSLTMLETMAMKTPLIASNIGGIKQVLEGNNAAYLVEPSDYSSIASIIDKLYEYPKNSEKKIENAYDLVKSDYSSTVWFKKIKQCYLTIK